MKQRIVVKVSMSDRKSRKKALITVVSQFGVESAALRGKEKNQIEVVGDGIDAAEMTILLRKKVGCTELVLVIPLDENKDGRGGDQKKQITDHYNPAAVQHIWPASYPYPQYQQPYYSKDKSDDPSATSCN